MAKRMRDEDDAPLYHGLTINEGDHCFDRKGDAASNFLVRRVIAAREAGTTGEPQYLKIFITVGDTDYSAVVGTREGSYCRQLVKVLPFIKVYGGAADRIDAFIWDKCKENPLEPYTYFPHDGLYHVDGGYVFVVGNEVVGKEHIKGRYTVNAESANHSLPSSDLDENSAYRGLWEALVKEPREGAVAWSYTLLCSFRSAIGGFTDTVFPCLYIFGPHGWGKSMLAKRFCLLCDEENGSYPYGKFEANSTEKGLYRELSHFYNCTVLVDDLPKATDPTIQKKCAKLFAEILRCCANGSRRTTASKAADGKQRCLCGVVFTGEDMLSAASEIERLICLPLTHPLQKGSSADRATAATVFRYFMAWVLPQLDEKLARLKESLNDAAIAGPQDIGVRFINSGILLDWAFNLYLEYGVALRVIDPEQRREANGFFNTELKNLFDKQQKLVEQIDRTMPVGNLAYYIQKAYREGYFNVVKRQKDLKDSNDALLEENILYVRYEAIINYLEENVPAFSYTKNRIGKYLREKRIVPDGKAEGKTASSKKGKKKRRYIPINLTVLKSAAEKY